MKQFNTISKLLSTLILPEELMAIVEKRNYTDIARKFKVENLLDFFMAAALEKWAMFRMKFLKICSIFSSPNVIGQNVGQK